eukprot:31452-Pelagococcus_subviridis.AAC.4
MGTGRRRRHRRREHAQRLPQVLVTRAQQVRVVLLQHPHELLVHDARLNLRVEGPSFKANVGVELKGVRSGVERRRGVLSGLKPRCDGRRETHDGK